MDAALAAARLDDPIEHSSKLAGFLIGGALCIAAAVAIGAAIFFTGGTALAALGAAGGIMGLTSLVSSIGGAIGSLCTHTTGQINKG